MNELKLVAHNLWDAGVQKRLSGRARIITGVKRNDPKIILSSGLSRGLVCNSADNALLASTVDGMK